MIFSEGPARNWRTRQQRYLLKAEICDNCSKAIFPPRDVCPHCAEIKMRDIILWQGLLEIQVRPTENQG
ncbi:MAG: zinc ribbon domain-containing protein [Candidatus Shapirobacteria bacterium]|jgi:uncharacterized OB-fold protein